MKNLFSSHKFIEAQERLNSVLERLEDVIVNNPPCDGEELMLENEELKEEIKDLMQQQKDRQKEMDLFKKKVSNKLDEVMEHLGSVLNGNS